MDAAGHVIVDSPAGTIVDIGPRGFAILSMFSRPLALGDALDRLEAEFGGSTDFAPTVSVVNMLIEENTLVAAAGGRAPTSGWADPIEHARMLHDDRRTGDFISALTAALPANPLNITGLGPTLPSAGRPSHRRPASSGQGPAVAEQRLSPLSHDDTVADPAQTGGRGHVADSRNWVRWEETAGRVSGICADACGTPPVADVTRRVMRGRGK